MYERAPLSSYPLLFFTSHANVTRSVKHLEEAPKICIACWHTSNVLSMIGGYCCLLVLGPIARDYQFTSLRVDSPRALSQNRTLSLTLLLPNTSTTTAAKLASHLHSKGEGLVKTTIRHLGIKNHRCHRPRAPLAVY